MKPSRKKIEPSKKDRERISKTLAQGCYSNINIASVPSKPSFEQVERYAYSFEALLFQERRSMNESYNSDTLRMPDRG